MQRNRSGNENSRNEAISAVVNGRVWTGDPWRPRAEAVAIDGDRILAVGTTDEVRSKLREQGVADIEAIKSLTLESDGEIGVIKFKDSDSGYRPQRKAPGV